MFVDTTYTRTFWEAAVGETVVCVPEPGIFHDRNAIAVEKDGIIIGHLPQKVSCICALFLKRWNGLLHCDWNTVGKTARQAKVTDYSCNYHNLSLQFNFALY